MEPDYDLLNKQRKENFNDGWNELRKWLHTTTGQEYLDEMVYGGVGIEAKNSLLQSVGLPQTQANREHFDKICDQLLSEGM